MFNDEQPNGESSDSCSDTDNADRKWSKGDFGSLMPALVRLSMIGWFIAISIVAGAFAGWWLDKLLNSSPLLLVLGILTGIAVAMAGMIRMIDDASKN